jgi:DNA-binding response OmpR family regulator
VRVLLIEDEPRLARNVARMLADRAGYAVDVAHDGETGLARALADPYDLVLLDLRLPCIDGLDVLRRLRAAGRSVPVLVLTARGGADHVARALEIGGDDYLTKPFEMIELCARARALIRRSYGKPDPVLRVGALALDTASCVASCGDRRARLPAMEYALLEYLALRAGEVVSKAEILSHLYGAGAERFANVIEVYVSTLRRRLGASIIHTVRNQGYVLTGERG